LDFSKLSGKIYINHSFRDNKLAKIHPLNHSLHFSGAIFEGIRAYNKRILFLEDHIDRLFYSAELMKLKLNIKKSKLIKICEKIIKLNKISDGYIRPIVFRSNHSMSPDISKCKSQIVIAAWNWGNLYNNSGLKITLSKYLKIDNKFFPVGAKSSASYQGSLLSKEIARRNGFDDILLLDRFSFVRETSACNIFWIKKNTVYTPNIENILNGITRQSIINICKKYNIKIQEGNFKLPNLMNAENMFVTGTATEIMSIKSLDKKIFKRDSEILIFLKKIYDKIKVSGIYTAKSI
jgi:branched-chain amino acid aminotransferase